MKVNIEIECTPVEARQFFGLPNVEPMQAAVMQQVEKRIIERFSPEALMTSWLPLVPQGAEQMQSFFRGIFPATSGPPKEEWGLLPSAQHRLEVATGSSAAAG